MNFIDWIGFLGVFQILLAYCLNVIGKITNKHIAFISLNLVGAYGMFSIHTLKLETIYNSRSGLGFGLDVFNIKL